MDENFGMYLVEIRFFLTSRKTKVFGKGFRDETEEHVVKWVWRYKAHSFDKAEQEGWRMVEWWKDKYLKLLEEEKTCSLCRIMPHDAYISKGKDGDFATSRARKFEHVNYMVSVEDFRPFAKMTMRDICKEMTGEEFLKEFGIPKIGE